MRIWGSVIALVALLQACSAVIISAGGEGEACCYYGGETIYKAWCDNGASFKTVPNNFKGNSCVKFKCTNKALPCTWLGYTKKIQTTITIKIKPTVDPNAENKYIYNSYSGKCLYSQLILNQSPQLKDFDGATFEYTHKGLFKTKDKCLTVDDDKNGFNVSIRNCNSNSSQKCIYSDAFYNNKPTIRDYMNSDEAKWSISVLGNEFYRSLYSGLFIREYDSNSLIINDTYNGKSIVSLLNDNKFLVLTNNIVKLDNVLMQRFNFLVNKNFCCTTKKWSS
ncbi:hypothetical protein BCR32DRAFT_298562 [Anaeromyces robustus]|uniref:Ricin B lectin domain-containing protein n=1 Tax=Anaeromyces robustus TaxID=1754192 RepID=A0A1Y1VI51_9FUNG|nr:hypothetical protein BCR32DRAFT_298562 [Anaeromyces robustus]|eukprot:ORX57083.1 hypothetical protein BCR32DRAFT_298562 [Anaeromyces robustus]